MWKFGFYSDGAGEWRWRLRAANGEIVGQGEGHARLADAVRSAQNFKANVGQAEIVRPKIARKRLTDRRPPGSSLLDMLMSDFRDQPR